jgi:RimJ/RimL family protein N-acetyltransferase
VREVGYWIERELWGRGIASAALEQFLRIETRRPLHAGVAAHNAASLRVLSKHGFAVAGRDGDHVVLRLD